MKYKFSYLIISTCLIFSYCALSQQNISDKKTLAATALKPYGRFVFDKDQSLELISSAVHFSFSFSGKECTVYAFINDANGHNYLQYELDGVYQRRIKIIGDAVQ